MKTIIPARVPTKEQEAGHSRDQISESQKQNLSSDI
jgi:hypothetical protein